MADDIEPKELRQSGRSTQQMIDAPRGAIYIWPNAIAYYPNKLAQHLRRTDLVIVSPSILDGNAIRLSGQRAEVVVDHAAVLTEDQEHALKNWRALLAAGKQ